MYRFLLSIVFYLIVSVACQDHHNLQDPLIVPGIPFSPRLYHALYTEAAPQINGIPDDPSWQSVSWSEDFVDIEGDRKPAPPLRTRVKMLWDHAYLYIAAELEEPDIRATLRQRDTVIFYDNDFEVFIDPDSDTQLYYEFEMNALGTVWDLLLTRPYRDGGRAINAWDITGIKVATYCYGTLNLPGDKDEKWTLEIAMPWKILKECAPGRRPPRSGDIWRVNFSRVEWDTDVLDGKYVKRLSAMSGKPLPEHNWVWSPQGIVNMHAPERWGYLCFETSADALCTPPVKSDHIGWLLRNIYYHERQYFAEHKQYAASLKAMNVDDKTFQPFGAEPVFYITSSGYEVTFTPEGGKVTYHIRQDGRNWKTDR